MSTGMLGMLPLSKVRGPRDTLEQNLAGNEGDRWLKALNRLLRGENPWPIVSRVIDTGRIFTPNQDDHIKALQESDVEQLEYLLEDVMVHEIDFGARQILESDSLKLEKSQVRLTGREPSYQLVILEFDMDEILDKGGLSPQIVLAEIRRLRLERPTFEDPLFFPMDSPLLGLDPIVFLHEPMRLEQDVGPGGMHLCVDKDLRYPGVLSLERSNARRDITLSTTNLNASIGYRFAARRWVQE